MDPAQAFDVEQFAARLNISDGTLMRMVREVAHDAMLRSIADLTWSQSEELIFWLIQIENGTATAETREPVYSGK